MVDYRSVDASLTQVLSSVSREERYFIRGMSVLAAALSMTLVAIQYIELGHLRPVELQLWAIMSYSLTDFWLRVRIAVALVISMLCLWRFRPKGFLLSSLALFWAVIEYVLWFVWSLRFKEALGTGRLPDPNIGGFYKAVFSDMVVLGLTIALVAWTTKRLCR